MAEYAILLVASSGTQWLQRLKGALDDPVLLWGGAAALILVAGWVLKPNR